MTEPALGIDFDIHIAETFERVYRKAEEFRAADTYFLDRVGSAIFYRIPQLLSLGRNLSTMNAIEIGCGRGTKSVCWAPLFKTYHGFDLDPTLIEEARHFGNIVSSNAQFSVANIAKVLADPAKFGIIERVDCIIAYAVIEHLTISEQETILSASREILNGHGLLIICEAPNRLIREDPHSSALPFFQMLPSKLARKYIGRSSRPEAKALANGTEEQFSRFGTGVSYHEFDLFLEDQRGDLPAIVGGGWDFWAASDEP